MKFSAVLFAAAASAAAINKREAVFKVSDFSASCIPHSSQCQYSFGVLQPGTMETTPVKCSAMLTSNNSLPDVPEGQGKCENSSRTFTVKRSAEGLTLTVKQPVTPSSDQSGSHLIPKDQIVSGTQPNAQVESYQGEPNFDLN
ncbi:hypothetical protein F4779DRAFT_29978 [Xylariaceae sp. FL0662B]|nr:hypothetical protein F4779DRAFT_29978 [Xylariaceae sp. FL0662B]